VNRHIVPITLSEVLPTPGPKALYIELTDVEGERLEKTVQELTASQQQVCCSQIVLLAQGLANAAIARQLRCSRYTIWK